MNTKKIVSIILSLLLVFQLTPAVFADIGASNELYITTPANGTAVPHTQKVFKAHIPEGKTAVSTLFYLDGEFIGDGGAAAAITASTELYFGKHTLELRAIYADGTGAIATSEFVAKLTQFVMDFEDCSEAVYSSNDAAKTALPWLNDVNTNMFNYGDVSVGSDATHGKVFKLNKTKGGTLYAGNGSFYFPSLYQSGNKIAIKTGKVVVEFDFKFGMGTNWASVLQVIPFTKNGHEFSGVDLFNFNKYTDNIPGTAVKLTDSNWHHAKVSFDLDNKKCNAMIDTVIIPEKDLTFPANQNETDFYSFRIGVAMSRTGDFLAVDNIFTGLEGSMGDFSGIIDVDYVNGSGDIIEADSAAVSRDVTKLILKTDRALNYGTLTKSNITVTLGGKAVDIAEISASADFKTITLVLNNTAGIQTNGESAVTLSENIQLSDNTPIGKKAIAKLKLEPKGFLVKSVSYQKAAGELFSGAMLREGDIIKATVKFQNVSDSTKPITAVLVVKDGDKYISLSADDIVVEKTTTTDYEVVISSPAIPALSQPVVYLMLLDNLNNCMYIDSYDLP